VNDVVAKFKAQAAANRALNEGGHDVAQILEITSKLGQDELSALLRGIAERSQERVKKEKAVKIAVTLHFLDLAIEKKEKELMKIETEMEVLRADKMRLSEAKMEHDTSQVSSRNQRVEANFGEILEDYLNIKLPRVGEPPDGQKSLERFCDGLDKFTQFRTFRELATLTYGDPTNNCCIVSSIEFDRDGEFFAVAGVTKKIKVFEYESVVRNAGFTNHFPVRDMSCAAKLSCVAYNPYHKHRLVSSDYEGSVCLWDTSTGQRTGLHQEHSRRVWSVAYSPQEPSLFASGSDDCTVKLWSDREPNSIFSFSARANICSVKFNPHSRYFLAYGSADHGVHYLDLRSPSKPLLELLGHKKAVSYVNFMGADELVSASTDSELKCWQTNGVCIRTYRGHTNDKNFVGLSVTPDFIACGTACSSQLCVALTNCICVLCRQ
jgi:E3 ubiquitin-protein ligase RFWD2